jgi:hypothetical protein
MTLGGMRHQGVRGFFVTCRHCGHERAVNMDDWGAIVRPAYALQPLRQVWGDGCAELDRTGRQITGRHPRR